MNFDGPDGFLRRSVFAWLADITDGGEGTVSWNQLQRGFVFGDEPVTLVGQKGIWKPRQMQLPISITTAPPRLDGSAPPYEDEVTDDGLLRYRYEGTDSSGYRNHWLRECLRLQVPLAYFLGVGVGEYFATWPALIVNDAQGRWRSMSRFSTRCESALTCPSPLLTEPSNASTPGLPGSVSSKPASG